MSTNRPSSEAELPLPAQEATFAPPTIPDMTPPLVTDALAPMFLPPVRQPSTTRFGLTISAIFVATGGLLLMLVFIMSMGLPAPQATMGAQVSLPQHRMATPELATPVTTPTPSTTPVSQYPGQLYIGDAQIASEINTTTAVPTEMTTRFKVRHKVFVTFVLHPRESGAVCLLWYINGAPFTHYEFPVNGIATPAWSYAFASQAGPGYVEIYWATNITCTDKLLAQRADFVVEN